LVQPRVVSDSNITTFAAPQFRIASVPAQHLYVRHTAHIDPNRSLVTRLPDPHPTEPGRLAGPVWWPPRMFDPAWVADNLDAFDIFHVQFGFDAVAPDDLRRIAQLLKSAGKPLVYTAHDLRNPHHLDSADHFAQLDVIMAEAAAVITLTDGAATEIRGRWRRDAVVIPHPHVVDFATMANTARPTRAPDAAFRVGLHVKSLRANMNPVALVRALAETHHEHPNTVLQVDGHPEVLHPDGARFNAELSALLTDYDRQGVIELRVHDYFTDDELWEYLGSLDASILPYRFGTHSGWLEACRDLGTAVIAPSCGYYPDQGPVFSYRNDDSGFDADSLVDAVSAASNAVAPTPLSVEFRRTQREEIAAAHERIYAGVLA